MMADDTPDGADRIATAAQWLAEHWHVAPQPITRTLREMFGLGFGDTVKVLVAARRIAELSAGNF